MSRINIAIASPGDVRDEHNAVPNVFNRWNEANSDAFLHPKMWEMSAPALGDHPQHILNPKILDESDLLVAIFWTKLGTPTPTANSGTVEEIREFIRKKGAGRVMVYFCKRSLPHDVDPAELARLREFQTQMRSQGVYYEYVDVKEFERDLYFHLDQKVAELLSDKLPLPEIPKENGDIKLREKELPVDKRLHHPIDFGRTLREISRGFASRMDQFDAIDGVSNDKFYALGAHVYDSVAICVDNFLTFSASRLLERERSGLERISTRLKRLSTNLPEIGAPFPEYWKQGREISDALSAHVAHIEKRLA
jgi:hypothetical protein